MNTRRVTIRSGLTLPVVEVVAGAGRRRQVREHPAIVRVTHWLNAVTLLVMTASGWEIFAAFPSFGAKVPQVDLIAVPAQLRLGGWLGGALQWHLTFMWLFMGTGAIYACYQLASGHWRQTIFSLRDAPGVWPMVRHYFFFREKPPQTEPYNPLQKLAYTAVLACAAVAVVTGWMLYKPVQLAPLLRMAGGFGMVRLWHFLAMCGLLGFLPGHLVMVALHGWNNARAMLTGWKQDPEYLEVAVPRAAPGAPTAESQAADAARDYGRASTGV